MLRCFFAFALAVFLSGGAFAQDVEQTPVDRSATGGAQTLQDILARQNGEKIDPAFRSDATGDSTKAASITGQLGTLGGVSDPELWRAFRYGAADLKVSAGGDVATVVIQDGGMRWLSFRSGPLSTYGAYLLGATLVLLAVFFAIRGRIRIDGKKTGRTVLRFKAVERFGHWLVAGSFILLGLTGLLTLFGRKLILPLLGPDANSVLLIGSKWVHNNVSWAFMLGLIMIFVMWVVHNLPSRTDLKWLAAGGGIFTKSHPPAKKFNAGQKLIFWSVIILGASISVSGLSLLFPFQLPLFGATFEILNSTGLPQALGYGELPTVFAPQEDMQLAQLWHAIMAFVLMAIIFAHIYIGSIGMEGAYDAMGSGEVEEQWAREHHSLWLEEISADTDGSTSPAE